jgi:hypothetical protein
MQQMTYRHAKILKVFESDDRKARVELLERKDCLYEFKSLVERWDYEEYEGPYEGYKRRSYWLEEFYAGLYETAEEAERAALAEVSWLRLSRSADAGRVEAANAETREPEGD